MEQEKKLARYYSIKFLTLSEVQQLPFVQATNSIDPGVWTDVLKKMPGQEKCLVIAGTWRRDVSAQVDSTNAEDFKPRVINTFARLRHYAGDCFIEMKKLPAGSGHSKSQYELVCGDILN